MQTLNEQRIRNLIELREGIRNSIHLAQERIIRMRKQAEYIEKQIDELRAKNER